MKPYKANTRNDLPRIAEVLGLNGEEVKDMQAVSAVLPFKVNNYVLEILSTGVTCRMIRCTS